MPAAGVVGRTVRLASASKRARHAPACILTYYSQYKLRWEKILSFTLGSSYIATSTYILTDEDGGPQQRHHLHHGQDASIILNVREQPPSLGWWQYIQWWQRYQRYPPPEAGTEEDAPQYIQWWQQYQRHSTSVKGTEADAPRYT